MKRSIEIASSIANVVDGLFLFVMPIGVLALMALAFSDDGNPWIAAGGSVACLLSWCRSLLDVCKRARQTGEIEQVEQHIVEMRALAERRFS